MDSFKYFNLYQLQYMVNLSQKPICPVPNFHMYKRNLGVTVTLIDAKYLKFSELVGIYKLKIQTEKKPTLFYGAKFSSFWMGGLRNLRKDRSFPTHTLFWGVKFSSLESERLGNLRRDRPPQKHTFLGSHIFISRIGETYHLEERQILPLFFPQLFCQPIGSSNFQQKSCIIRLIKAYSSTSMKRYWGLL